MLKLLWNTKKRRGERGFTLIELVVVLAILGILIALAVPRYLGSRRNALVNEGQNVMQELKTLAWAYYQQYSTFSGATVANMGFTEPSSGCWTYTIQTQNDTLITYSADPATGRTICSILPGTSRIFLTLNGNGSSSASSNF